MIHRSVCYEASRSIKTLKLGKSCLKVIPQKLKVTDEFFFETFPECSLPGTVSKNTIKNRSAMRTRVAYELNLKNVIGQEKKI